jgi:hypothetical protein
MAWENASGPAHSVDCRPPSAASVPPDRPVPAATLDARWLEREDLMRGDLILREQLDHARAKLPDWANTGYSELDSEGNKCGLESGWPEIANLPETSGGPGVIATIRPSPYDYKKRLRIEADVFGRETAVARYKSRMRAFIARRREQTRLMADLGITEAERQLEQHADRQWDIGSAIMDLPPSINQALAAAIIDAGQETATGCTANDPTKPFVGVFRLAQALRSQATGAVRASIDRIFDNPDETLEDLAILPF